MTLQHLIKLFSNISSIGFLPHALIYKIAPLETRRCISFDAMLNNSKPNYPPPNNLISLLALSHSLRNNPYLRTLFFHRIKHLKIRKILWGNNSRLEIPYDVTIGPGVILDHPFSTILNAKSIGRNLRIKNNITIGNKNDDESLRPTLGDDVYIGAGAIIIGGITIGNNVKIGAGAVVVQNLPDNCIAVGNPARIIFK